MWRKHRKGWGGGWSYISESRQQYNSEDAELSVVVCRLNELHMFKWTTDCERKVVDIHDWRVCGTRDYKYTNILIYLFIITEVKSSKLWVLLLTDLPNCSTEPYHVNHMDFQSLVLIFLWLSSYLILHVCVVFSVRPQHGEGHHSGEHKLH